MIGPHSKRNCVSPAVNVPPLRFTIFSISFPFQYFFFAFFLFLRNWNTIFMAGASFSNIQIAFTVCGTTRVELMGLQFCFYFILFFIFKNTNRNYVIDYLETIFIGFAPYLVHAFNKWTLAAYNEQVMAELQRNCEYINCILMSSIRLRLCPH